MSARPVEAIFLWRFNQSAFAAVYGRDPASGPKGAPKGSYTKNYLQSPATQHPTIDRVLGRAPNGKVEFEFLWPDGGNRPGHWQKSAADTRGQLYWDGNSNPPEPWKVGDPAATSACTIPGDPSKATVSDANAEFDRIAATGTTPVLALVKLWGEPGRLYPRVILANPPADQTGRGLATLPEALRQAVTPWLASNDGAFALELNKPCVSLRIPILVERIVRALHRDPNVLLVGPPGTGKTVVLEDLRNLFEAKAAKNVLFDPDVWDNAWSESGAETDLLPPDEERRVEQLVFHPSYGFEEFVAGLVPRVAEDGHQISLKAQPGPLLSLAHWASSPSRRALLILDEFNRGPAAAIFGATLALLDGSKRENRATGHQGASIRSPYPHSPMTVDEGYENDGGNVIGKELRFPATLWIVAALNSTDRSVAPLDAALRRRFSIIRVDPDYDALARHLGLDAAPTGALPPIEANPDTWNDDGDRRALAALAVRLLQTLNERVAAVLGQDFMLGHALLWNARREGSRDMLDALATAFDERITATLRLTLLDQDEALAAILNAGPIPTDGSGAPSAGPEAARWRPPPSRLQTIATARLELLEISALNAADKLKVLKALL